MDVILKKIYALQKSNEEIITRVESVKEVVTYDYWIQYGKDGFAKLNEDIQKQKVDAIVRAHKPEPKFKTDIWDVFNDKPDWSAKSWDDLKRLNLLILSIVEKFELLDKSNKKVALELEKYLHNLEEIQQSLGVVESKSLSQRSRKDEFAAGINDINQKLKVLFNEGLSLQSKLGFLHSTILMDDHKAKLIDWYGSGWTLLYKASRDGWDVSKFHELCDNKGKTVTVISHSNGAYLIGGYTEVDWNTTAGWKRDPKASVFTLSNPRNVAPSKFSSNGSGDNVYCGVGYGPTFGGGHDIYVSNNANNSASSSCSFPYSYTDTTGVGRALFDNGSHWNASEVEVFYVPS